MKTLSHCEICGKNRALGSHDACSRKRKDLWIHKEMEKLREEKALREQGKSKWRVR